MDRTTTVSELYADIPEWMLKFGGDLLACHYGLWGPDTKTEVEGLLRANQTLVQGCELGPGKRVLDAGCGLGGTAMSLVDTYGVHATGLTICKPHVEAAREYAKQRGIDHLAEFCHGDFMDLPFPDASFDLVLNQESFCYAQDKLAYLRGVLRVLRPGGRWQSLEGYLNFEPMSEAQEAMHLATQRGWCMPPLENWKNVLASLEEAGFVDIRDQDMSSEAMRPVKRVSEFYRTFSFIYPNASGFNQAARGFVEAAYGYDQGLRAGLFSTRLISGARPA